MCDMTGQCFFHWNSFDEYKTYVKVSQLLKNTEFAPNKVTYNFRQENNCFMSCMGTPRSF